MPKRSRKRDLSADPNVSAFKVLQKMMADAESDGKNPMAVALGRLGGLKGGRARAEKLSASERNASAVKAARARWGKRTKD
jgi:hypothetical protein